MAAAKEPEWQKHVAVTFKKLHDFACWVHALEAEYARVASPESDAESRGGGGAGDSPPALSSSMKATRSIRDRMRGRQPVKTLDEYLLGKFETLDLASIPEPEGAPPDWVL
jgi:hypothetical protein